MVRIDQQIRVLACVRETAQLLFIIPLLPIQSAAPRADREGGIQVNQNIGVGDLLPHGLHVGMFLRDVAAFIAMSFETRAESGFT